MKTKKQFILETLLPYKEDPSTCAVIDGQCRYLLPDGRRCAVGKHMIDGDHQFRDVGIHNLWIEDEYDLVNTLTPEAYAIELTVNEWILVQRYHDYVALRKGVSKVNMIVQKLEQSINDTLTELKF